MNSTAVEPAKAPPPGEESNFVDPPSIQTVIIFALTLELAVSTISAVIRCYSQWYLFKKLIWVDYCMLIGWAFQVAFVGLLYDCLPYGGGRHLWDVTKSDFAHISYLLFIDYILYGCAILGPKIAILLQLIAIFVPRGRNLGASSRLFFWAGWGLIAVNLIFYISHNFLLIFQCNPIRKGWDPSTPGTCLEQFSLIESSAPFNIVSDVLIFILPLSSIWRLNLPVKTRFGIASAFAVGLFGVICSGIRLSYSDRLAKSGDITYLVFQNQAWANAEITAAILISNVIILPRFLRALRKGDSSQRYTHEKYSQNKYGQKSRAKSGGLRGEFDFQFGPHDRISESYIELGDRQSETVHEDEQSITKAEESPSQSGVGYAITRTVEIERTEEDIAFPEPVLSPGPHNQVITNVIGSAKNT